MTQDLICIRHASENDAPQISEIHETSWRLAYQGMLPHLALEKSIARRGPGWWQSQLQRSRSTLVLEMHGEIGGYATIGRNRVTKLPYHGEIYELYMKPTYQGLGLGSRLFNAARRTLESRDASNMIVWALKDNSAACRFYEGLGGRPVAEQNEKFGSELFRKIAFGWAVT